MGFLKGENKIEIIFKELTETFPEVNKHMFQMEGDHKI